MNSFLDDLPDKPCPRGGAGLGKESRVKSIAELQVQAICTGGAVTYAALMKEFGDATSNYIANICGAGHFSFWRSKKPPGIQLCIENVRPALCELSDSELSNILAAQGLTHEEFREKCISLPPAK